MLIYFDVLQRKTITINGSYRIVVETIFRKQLNLRIFNLCLNYHYHNWVLSQLMENYLPDFQIGPN